MPDANGLFMVLFGLALVGYIALYMGGRYYLREYFQSGGGAGAGSPMAKDLYPERPPVAPPLQKPSDSDECPKKRVIMEYTTPDTVAREAIQSLDDYEYNLLYQNESDRELSTQLRNKLMSQRPMDWAGLPPSSSEFQAGLRESFQNATQTVPDNAQPFIATSGESMIPPDTQTAEMNEREALQKYVPSIGGNMTTYDVEDAEKLIMKIYDEKGLIPTVAHKEGTNVYQVVGVRRKDEKVVYEDEEAPASVAPVLQAGEARIIVPPSAYDTAAAKDPYYDTSASGGKTRTGKWDYQAWTPGLERMFAPSNNKQDWY